MAFPAPTRADGYLITAADWNADLVANVNDLNGRVNLGIQLTQQTLAPTTGSLAQANTTTVLLLNPGGAIDVYGAAAPVRTPWQMFIINISGSAITLKHESSSEANANLRFRLPNDTDKVLALGQGITFLYISVPVGGVPVARWVAVVGA